MTNNTFKNAVFMCLLQIGELSGKLTNEMKKKHEDIPWKNIIGFRNIVDHNYEVVSRDELWFTITEDVPVLKDKCLTMLKGYEEK